MKTLWNREACCLIECDWNLRSAKVCLFIRYQNPDAWGLMGHLYYLTSRTEEAQDCYERTLAYTTEASDMHAIYLRLASIYLEKGEVGVTLYYLSF